MFRDVRCCLESRSAMSFQLNESNKKKSVFEEHPSIAAIDEELRKSRPVAQNGGRKRVLNRSQASWCQLVPVGASWGQFNFELPDSQDCYGNLGPLGASSSLSFTNPTPVGDSWG